MEAACKFVSDIYTFKSLYVRDRCVLKFGKMQSGNVRNAISPFSRLDGTMRTFHEETWETLVNAMKSLGEEIEKVYGVKFDLDVSKVTLPSSTTKTVRRRQAGAFEFELR